MKTVNKTKRASTKQMLQMAVNLRRKFDCYASIQAEACGHQRAVAVHNLYVAGHKGIQPYRFTTHSWKELQNDYFRIMGEQDD